MQHNLEKMFLRLFSNMARKVGQKSIKLTAQVLTPDEYGRMRFQLVNVLKSGKKDYSADFLKKLIPEIQDVSIPYKMWESKDDTVGEFWVSPPKKYKDMWEKKYVEWRRAEVVVEVVMRRFSFVNKDGVARVGMALDLVDMCLATPNTEQK